MGANFVSVDYPARFQKETVQVAFDHAVKQSRFEDGHEYSGEIGMASGLLFAEQKPFETEDAALEWLQDHAQKWEEAQCVRLTDGRWIIGAWCAS